MVGAALRSQISTCALRPHHHLASALRFLVLLLVILLQLAVLLLLLHVHLLLQMWVHLDDLALL